MKNSELFRRDPKTANLVNDGQARILNDGDDPRAEAMLRYELEHFVCEGQYALGLNRILSSYLANLGASAQRAAWVSGFYGSGKSHLLKMLCHLWNNTAFRDGASARGLAPDLPKDLLANLRELDNQGKRAKGGVFAVSGTMPEGSSESARLTVLGILFRGCGLPSAYNQARFCLYLRDKGYYDQVAAHVAKAGKDFRRELLDLYVSPHIRAALIACDPGIGDDREVRELLRTQFPNKTDVGTDEFVRLAKEALQLKGNGDIPLTVIVLDEVQHYIGDSKDRSMGITELTEALNKQMASRVLVVGAGQNALSTDTPQFSWLRDRFTIRVELSDADVETVTRKVLLAKKAEVVSALEAELEKNSGEISRQLAKTSLAATGADREWLATDYPILPTRRRFWEHALHAVDPSGSSSLLRTQLRITHEALREVADQPLGHVIPGDFMFFQQQTALVQQGILPREISDRILKLRAAGTKEGEWKARICGLVFLIRKLSRDKGLDTGLRATEESIGDLLVQDLAGEGAKLRHELPALLRELVDASVLLHDGAEYNLQTKESAEWDDLFRNQIAKIRHDVAAVSQERRSRLRAAVEAVVRQLRVLQGSAKTSREFNLHFGSDDPESSNQVLPVWVKDGWEVDLRHVQGKAREAGPDSPVLFVFLPQERDDVLRESMIRMKAAQAVLDLKGTPTTRPAEEAQAAMQARRNDSERTVDQILAAVLANAKVFKGGGVELFAVELIDKLTDGANDALKRLFPRFDEADQKGWETAANRARQGDDTPLNAIGWRGATEDHPVCKEILHHVGAGKEGRHILAHFQRAPYGWDKDAVHGALVCLCASGRLLASDPRSSESLSAKHLDHPRIAKAAFRIESVTLTAKDKIALRGLFQTVGIACKLEDDLNARASDYLGKLLELAGKAVGDAPLPARSATTAIEDLRRLAGNEQLAKILEQHAVLKAQASEWKQAADLATKRLPAWGTLVALRRIGADVPELAGIHSSAAAIEKERRLLDPQDHVAPLVREAAEVLRKELTARRQEYREVRERELQRLEQNESWKKLTEDQRRLLRSSHPVPDAESSSLGSEEELIAALQATPLRQWADRRDALAGRVDKLLGEAARLLEPAVQQVRLGGATLRTEADVKGWLAAQEQVLLAKIKTGPVVVS